MTLPESTPHDQRDCGSSLSPLGNVARSIADK
jgi:hypothetical protein